MRILFTTATALAMLAPLAASAQTAAPAVPALLKPYVSASEMTALVAQAKKDRKDGETITFEKIPGLAPIQASLEYRSAANPPNMHEDGVELFYVVEGSGTLILGGKLINEKRLNESNLNGTGVDGGSPVHLAKGDIAIVPRKTVHWINEVGAGGLFVISIHPK